MRESIQKQTILGIIDLYTIAVNCNRAILLYIIVNIALQDQTIYFLFTTKVMFTKFIARQGKIV